MGKLTNEELHQAVLRHLTRTRSQVKEGSDVGVDCATIKSDDFIMLTTDPITASGSNCGLLSVHVCANDLASAMATPLCMLLTIIAPKNATLDQIEEVVIQAQAEASKINVDIVGGHTEYSDSVVRLITSVTMIGLRSDFNPVKVSVGDSIIVTKTLGLEGTAILVNDRANELDLSQEEIAIAKDTVNSLSVLPESRVVADYAKAMHDVTEGGVLGAMGELANRLKCGCELYKDSFPYLPVTEKICSQLSIDKDRLIGSGSMIIITDKPDITLQSLQNHEIKATVIGVITDRNDVVVK